MLVTSIDYDEHKGRIAIGRAAAGFLQKGTQVGVCCEGVEGVRTGRLTNLFVYDNFAQVPVDEVQAGACVHANKRIRRTVIMAVL